MARFLSVIHQGLFCTKVTWTMKTRYCIKWKTYGPIWHQYGFDSEHMK